MELIIAAFPAALVAGLLAVVAGVSYRLWRSAMRDERLLMHEVIARKGLSLDGCRDPDLLRQAGAAARRCMLCRDRDTCIGWLDGEVTGPVERFCPNAELLAKMQTGEGA
jgi:hypothetical protein